MVRLLRFLFTVICIELTTSYGFAMDVGTVTFVLPTQHLFTTKTIYNDSATTNIYSISLHKISSPDSHEKEINLSKGELLYSPHTLFLRPNQTGTFKLYYRGPHDSKERYYRVDFREIPLTLLHNSFDKQQVVHQEVLNVSTIFVVRPWNYHFHYQFLSEKKYIKNTGNGFFKLILYPYCHGDEKLVEAYYLLPNQAVYSELLSGKNRKFIATSNAYIPLDQRCQPK